MDPQVVVDKKSEEPDLKRQKLEEEEEEDCEEMSSYSESTCSFDSEDERLVEEEYQRSGVCSCNDPPISPSLLTFSN